MKSVLAFLFAVLLASAVFAVPVEKRRNIRANGGTVAFASENVTLSNENTFSYRESSLGTFSLLGLNMLFYTAVEATATGDSQSGSASGSGVFGLGYAGPSVPLSLWAAFVEANMQYSKDTSQDQLSDLDVSASASLVLSVYSKIEEMDASGDVVKTIEFKDLTFALSDVEQVDGGGVTNALSYATFSTSSNGADITLTVITSNIVGRLDVGAVVTPQCLEAVLEIDSYDYADDANHLRLTVIGGAGSYSAKVHAEGNLFVSGNDVNAPYVLLGGDAVVGTSSDDNSVEVVVVSKWEDASTDDLPNTLSGQVTSFSAQGSATFTLKTATVDFPANAGFISYDPQVGFNVPGSAATLIPSLAVLLAVIVAFFKF